MRSKLFKFRLIKHYCGHHCGHKTHTHSQPHRLHCWTRSVSEVLPEGRFPRARRLRVLTPASTTDPAAFPTLAALLQRGPPGAVVACGPGEMPALGSAVPLLLPGLKGGAKAAAAGVQAGGSEPVDHSSLLSSFSVGRWVKIKMLSPLVAAGQVQLLFGTSSRASEYRQAAGAKAAAYSKRLSSGTINMHAPLDLGNLASRE